MIETDAEIKRIRDEIRKEIQPLKDELKRICTDCKKEYSLMQFGSTIIRCSNCQTKLQSKKTNDF